MTENDSTIGLASRELFDKVESIGSVCLTDKNFRESIDHLIKEYNLETFDVWMQNRHVKLCNKRRDLKDPARKNTVVPGANVVAVSRLKEMYYNEKNYEIMQKLMKGIL